MIPNLDVNHIDTRNNSVSIIGIMVEFQPEVIDDPRTTGDGTFLLQSDINSLVTCYESDQLRCNGFLVDPTPHNALYFEDQIKATPLPVLEQVENQDEPSDSESAIEAEEQTTVVIQTPSTTYSSLPDLFPKNWK